MIAGLSSRLVPSGRENLIFGFQIEKYFFSGCNLEESQEYVRRTFDRTKSDTIKKMLALLRRVFKYISYVCLLLGKLYIVHKTT